MVLSNGLWKRRYGSDKAIVGRAISLGGESYTIIGVLASNFSFDPEPDLYLPFQADPNSTNQGHYFRVAARLKPGVSLASAKAALSLAGRSSGVVILGRLARKTASPLSRCSNCWSGMSGLRCMC